jgi:hypothetical protein
MNIACQCAIDLSINMVYILLNVGKSPTSSYHMDTDLILTLYKRPETVFTIHEIAQLFPQSSYKQLRDRLYYFTKAGKLKRPHQGMYTKEPYNPLELANKLYTPSYISLETVLVRGGVVFQYYTTVFAVSHVTRTVEIDNARFQYRHIKGNILTNPQGIESKDGYSIASLERAFLDAVYIYKNYYFDNLGGIDWKKIQKLKILYGSRTFEKRVEEYYHIYKEDHGKH